MERSQMEAMMRKPLPRPFPPLQVQAAALGEIHYLRGGKIERASAMLLESPTSERAWETWRTRACWGDSAAAMKGAS